MVSVFVPTMSGGLSHLAKLMPLLSQEKGIEIIIIDNNSKDGTLQYLSSYDCIVKINTRNNSFSVANNQAAQIANGDYFLLLNNDTMITPGFAQEMVSTFQVDPDIGIVGCLIYGMGLPKRVYHAGVCFTQNYIPYELGLEVPGFSPGIVNNDDRVSSVREVASVTAACMMVKREVYLGLGGLDEEYKNGWEDTDFVLRARELGVKSWYTGKTHIYHQKFGSYGRLDLEQQNRQRYDSIWIDSGRAKNIIGDRREL